MFVFTVVLISLLNAMPIFYNRNPKGDKEWVGFLSGILGFVMVPLVFIFSLDFRIAGTTTTQNIPPQLLITALILLTNLYFTIEGTIRLIKKLRK